MVSPIKSDTINDTAKAIQAIQLARRPEQYNQDKPRDGNSYIIPKIKS